MGPKKPIDLGVRRSKGKVTVTNLVIFPCPLNNFSLQWPSFTKLGVYNPSMGPKKPIDLGVRRSKVKVTVTDFVISLSAQ